MFRDSNVKEQHNLRTDEYDGIKPACSVDQAGRGDRRKTPCAILFPVQWVYASVD